MTGERETDFTRCGSVFVSVHRLVLSIRPGSAHLCFFHRLPELLSSEMKELVS